MVMLHIKFKGNMVANILHADPPPTTLGDIDGVKLQLFSEHGHVTYPIKGNHEFSNMVSDILPADPLPPSPDPGVNMSKFNFFRTLHVVISSVIQFDKYLHPMCLHDHELCKCNLPHLYINQYS